MQLVKKKKVQCTAFGGFSHEQSLIWSHQNGIGTKTKLKTIPLWKHFLLSGDVESRLNTTETRVDIRDKKQAQKRRFSVAYHSVDNDEKEPPEAVNFIK